MKIIRSVIIVLVLFIFQNILVAQDVPYVPTSPEVVNAMLKLAEVTSDDKVYDLGCGDGRIVVAAARDFGATGVGVDSNPERIKESNTNAKNNNVEDKVNFYEQNLFEADIKDATVVTLYLLNSVNLKLRPKLFEELKPGTRVVSHAFNMDEWSPDSHKIVDNRDVYLWIIPENFSGTWSDNSNGNFNLELDQEFQKVSGRLTLNGQSYDITNAELQGKNISFSANGNGTELSFEGELNDDRLTGKLISADSSAEISVTRESGTKKALEPSLMSQTD